MKLLLDQNLSRMLVRRLTDEYPESPAEVIEHAIDQFGGRDVVDRATTMSMIDTTMATISEKQSSWRPTELLRELAVLVPTDTVLPAPQLFEWLNKLTDRVVSNYCIDVSKPIKLDALLRAGQSGAASTGVSGYRPAMTTNHSDKHRVVGDQSFEVAGGAAESVSLGVEALSHAGPAALLIGAFALLMAPVVWLRRRRANS